jgi:hypothetical protein
MAILGRPAVLAFLHARVAVVDLIALHDALRSNALGWSAAQGTSIHVLVGVVVPVGVVIPLTILLAVIRVVWD